MPNSDHYFHHTEINLIIFTPNERFRSLDNRKEPVRGYFVKRPAKTVSWFRRIQSRAAFFGEGLVVTTSQHIRPPEGQYPCPKLGTEGRRTSKWNLCLTRWYTQITLIIRQLIFATIKLSKPTGASARRKWSLIESCLGSTSQYVNIGINVRAMGPTVGKLIQWAISYSQKRSRHRESRTPTARSKKYQPNSQFCKGIWGLLA